MNTTRIIAALLVAPLATIALAGPADAAKKHRHPYRQAHAITAPAHSTTALYTAGLGIRPGTRPPPFPIR